MSPEETDPNVPRSPFLGPVWQPACDSIFYSAIATSEDRRSSMARLLSAQGLDRIHRCGAMCGNIAGNKSRNDKQGRNNRQR